MDILLNYQDNVLKQVPQKFKRFLFDMIHWQRRMVAIKGPRGAGKTTIMLQHLIHRPDQEIERPLYITADHYWFYTHTLFETTDVFYKADGRFLFIDEVHKYLS